MKNWLNPNWLLSRLLERIGVGGCLARTEFAAHFFAGTTFALAGVLWGSWLPALWVAWTCVDEFYVDGWKGKGQGYDTIIDLASKLAGPAGFAIWRLTA